MNRFSLEKVLKIKNLNENKEIDVVRYHYDRVVYKIKEAYNQYKEGCYYDVDLFISKLPLYDSFIIAEKLVDYLKKKGFECKVVYQNRIFIWWKVKERKKEHIKVIQKELEKRIESFAKDNKDFCFYKIPLFISGYPWYDSEETAKVIAKKFSKKGFVIQIEKDILYVSWKREDIEKKSNIKLNFETKEEKHKKAMEKINFINENRFIDFVNPKTSKRNEFLIGLNNLKKDINKYI